MTDPQLPPPPPPGIPSTPPAPGQGAAPQHPAAPPQPPVAPPQAPLTPPVAPVSPAQAQPAVPTDFAAPPGASAVPVGGYAAPAPAAVAQGSEKRSPLLGRLALIVAIIGVAGSTLISSIAAFMITAKIGSFSFSTDDPDSLAVFTPVRDQVLLAEIGFWVGTALGVVAIALGITAIARRAGRGTGIAALIVAVIGAGVFFGVVMIALVLGTALS